MRTQGLKLSASGQALGGKMMFDRRIGFSGTPSELIPLEFKGCNYEKGSDGKILNFLTSTEIVTLWDLKYVDSWSVENLLKSIASCNPPFHALIDTGALVTGLTNYEVAAFLLRNGLEGMDGVVFLDDEDRKMILLRDGFIVMPLERCGVPREKRFSFYDQIHTTGMDIKQPLVCKALLTLGKDMTFRDYAQGAWRMRGIGKGQVIQLCVIPEVRKLIAKNIAICGRKSVFEADASNDQPSALKEVCEWLVINGMKSERTQFNMLGEQNMTNLWRKQAFNMLCSGYRHVGMEKKMEEFPSLEHAIDLFRERIDYSIANIVPKAQNLPEKLDKLLNTYEGFLDDADWAIAEYIQKVVRGSAEMNSLFSGPEADEDESRRAFESENLQENEEEAEDEQEQEQEQEVEVEQEVEKQEQDEEFVKKKYSTKEQPTFIWDLVQLQEKKPVEQKGNYFPFYPQSDFKIFNEKLNGSGEPLKFPHYMMVSQNYFTLSLAGLAHRRLKNVIVVLEWVPDSSSINIEPPVSRTIGSNGDIITPAQGERINRAFNFFDRDKTGSLAEDEFAAILQAIDVEHPENVSKELGIHVEFPLALREFRTIISKQEFHFVERGRYFVILSLEEAESLRGVIHSRSGTEIFPGVSIALRLGSKVLDHSVGFKRSPEYQEYSAAQLCRFFNSDIQYRDRELSVILRSIQDNPREKRKLFFDEVRSCRRRVQRDSDFLQLATVFRMEDEFALFEFRAIISCIRFLLKKRGLGAYDAFRAFDILRDGLIYCSELYGGLTWLGLDLVESDVYSVMKYVDATGEGRIRYTDFLAAFGDADNDDGSGFLESASTVYGTGDVSSFSRPTIQVRMIPELYEMKLASDKDVVKEIASDVLERLKVKTKPVKYFKFVWSTEGTKARKPVSIWANDIETYNKKQRLRRNKTQVSIGDYAIDRLGRRLNRLKSPSELQGMTIQITDRNINMLFKSENLTESHLNHLLPHPQRFKRVWSKMGGKTPLVIWRAVPPDGFVTLGMVATNSEDTPSLTCIRCVPLAWVKQVTEPPTLLWDDAGTGGKRGSFWKVNSMGSLWVVEDLEPPEGPFYDLLATKLYAGEHYSKSSHDALFGQSDTVGKLRAMSSVASGGDSSDEDAEDKFDSQGDPSSPKRSTIDRPSISVDSRASSPVVVSGLLSPKLLPGWKETQDPETGETYYYNESTGESSWEPPTAPDPPKKPDATTAPATRGFSLSISRLSDSQTSKTAVVSTGKSTAASTKPDSTKLSVPVPSQLPSGWSEAVDPDSGETYYYNEQTGVTQWEHPTK